MISLVSVFLVSLVIVFIIGFICGHCVGRKSKSKSSKTETLVPLYEDALPSAAQHQGQHDLELNENEAYTQALSRGIRKCRK